MHPAEYASLLEQLCLASDTHDWVTFEQLLPRTRQAHTEYNLKRLERGWLPIVVYEESWDMLHRQAHAFVWN